MGPIFAQVQKHAASHAGILLPTFRTTATVGGLVLFSTGLTGLFFPFTMASQFGIPLESRPPLQKNKEISKDMISIGDQKVTKAWITACSGREIVLGLLILSLLYLKEYRALGVVMTLGNIVGVVDAIAAWKGGVKGAWKMHVIPTILLVWVGPLGMLLSGLE